MHEAPHLLRKGRYDKPSIILRHDVDLDLDKALIMAEIESELNISSCYMVMTNSPFYKIEDKSSRAVLLRLRQLGHEVALHFDFDNQDHRRSDVETDSLAPEINSSIELLEDIISSNVHSISFHRPLRQFIKGPLFMFGRVNAYSAELMEWYLSDSKGNWRNGEPLPMLENPKKGILQLLIHPIWWGKWHISASDRLQLFYEMRTERLLGDEIIDFDDKLSSHLTVSRSKKGE